MLIFPAGSTQACRCAASFLSANNIPVTFQPTNAVTHLLLDIPSFTDQGRLRNGEQLSPLLKSLPPDIQIIGGNLNRPELAGYHTYDLLQQEEYLCSNAAITANCALRVALPEMTSILPESSALILGWGRIGKCLGKLLKQNGASVWLSIRNPKERALARALGYQALTSDQDPPCPEQFSLLFNTVPHPVLSEERLSKYSSCVKIDLASSSGLAGEDVITARGLPGKYAPESSGKLICQTILDLFKEE